MIINPLNVGIKRNYLNKVGKINQKYISTYDYCRIP